MATTAPVCTARIPHDGVGGFGAFFLLLDEPQVYGLPPRPADTTRDLPEMWRSAAVAAGVLALRSWPAYRRAAMIERPRDGVLLRPANRQAARLGAGDRVVSVQRGAGGRFGGTALAARAAGNRQARAAAILVVSGRGLTVSPALLIRDLGRPERIREHAARVQADLAHERR